MKTSLVSSVTALLLVALASSHAEADEAGDRAKCETLVDTPNLTVVSARIVEAKGATPRYCYAKGAIPPGIRYHVQLPLAANWNGRFLAAGDGGKDGDLDFADDRLAEGYAVVNSNMGHDDGAEPGASFAFDNRQAEIDFGYRAVHTSTTAGKTLVRAYYGKTASYSYFEGCSTGGREGLMEAQRFPTDFDGIVAGAPVLHYQELNAGHTWLLQRTFKDKFAGNLAYSTKHDGNFDSVKKLQVLADAVMKQCDALDGIKDGVIDDPRACQFNPDRDLKSTMCKRGEDGESCFTPAQLQTVKDFYSGPYDSKGRSIIKGRAPGAELDWEQYIPHAGNRNFPGMLRGAANGHTEFLFYEKDPGVPVAVLNDLSRKPDLTRMPPEHAWWEFDIDDLTAGKADFMKAITNADDPNMSRFLVERRAKLILWHGWADGGAPPEPTLDYYSDVVNTTFGGDLGVARERTRIFMFPGMGHCSGGAGPDRWDPLAPLVAWVENGTAPDSVVARHETNGAVDNERRVCAYPERAVYTGPAGGENDRTNWVAGNFRCEARQ
jgi:Tannase and feruloyl esterase